MRSSDVSDRIKSAKAEGMLTVSQVSLLSGKSPASIRKMIEKGQIGAVYIGGRWFIPPSDADGISAVRVFDADSR